MRLSVDTLLLLAKAGDQEALRTLFWMFGLNARGKPTEHQNLDATISTRNGHIGAGWPGAGHFYNHQNIRVSRDLGNYVHETVA